ncbi:hypothetical protein XELAEV_18033852mg [Xenopus laevis]|uniref:Uncharacterized protein n=1 Tax=Xenopus laevis TaxID=8355 RepID=A0A974CLE6_XENLA|nr:hypothetical protein XELAEV_18033852mg [Xenopus laevis]
MTEFHYFRNHAFEPLDTFQDFITYSYMIDNIILLITGTLHQRPISELVPSVTLWAALNRWKLSTLLRPLLNCSTRL